MIKFFRKIRQGLLSKGNTGKYLKYALGEIVLVVFGILIALSINNWNSDRLQSKKNKQLLRKMSKELDQHGERLSRLLDPTGTTAYKATFAYRATYTDSLYKILDKGIEPEDFDYFIGGERYYSITLNFNTTVFEELLNTGNLYAVGSDSLVEKIQQYYQRYKRQKFYNTEIGTKVADLQKACSLGYIDFEYWYQKNPENAIAENSWIYEPKSENYVSFRIYMGYFRSHSRIMVEGLTVINEMRTELKTAINNEIESL